MADCNITLPLATLEDATINLVPKIQELSAAALATDSVYMRAKDTFKELLDGKKINESEYAKAASEFITQLSVTTTQSIIQAALQYAIKEKELGYDLAQSKASTELVQAQREKVKADICLAEKESDLKCAQITATIAGSIRDNGTVTAVDPTNACIPTALADEGTKYEQALFIQSQKYGNLADAYRKSGVVQITTDSDGILKGTSGNDMGYTDAQEEFARRQILSFEDSKRNHAANAISQMIGQLLSAEVVPAAEYVTQWNDAIGYLNTNTPGA